MDGMDLTKLAASQHGVLSRTQALGALSRGAVRWKLKRGLWQQVHPGVYAVHTQPLEWLARASAALLFYGEGSALALESAAFLLGIESKQPALVHVDVPIGTQREKRVMVKVRRRRRLEITRRQKLRVTAAAFTVIDLGDLATASREDAIAVAALAVQRRKTTAPELVKELGKRRTHQHRRALELSLGIVAEGAESVLEVDFVTRVLRAHGLPEMRMAVAGRAGGVSIRRDFVDETHQIVVEVDGRVAHEGRRGADNKRDRSTAARGAVTLRAEWVDVYYEACHLAADLFGTLRSRGYQGTLGTCGPNCKALRHLRRSA